MSKRLPKMMIGFVVRRCTIELGHRPSPTEFALWANSHGDAANSYCLFGRPITDEEAGIILRHQARLVTAKSATAEEQYLEDDGLPALPSGGDNVVRLDDVRRRLAASGALRRKRAR